MFYNISSTLVETCWPLDYFFHSHLNILKLRKAYIVHHEFRALYPTKLLRLTFFTSPLAMTQRKFDLDLVYLVLSFLPFDKRPSMFHNISFILVLQHCSSGICVFLKTTRISILYRLRLHFSHTNCYCIMFKNYFQQHLILWNTHPTCLIWRTSTCRGHAKHISLTLSITTRRNFLFLIYS